MFQNVPGSDCQTGTFSIAAIRFLTLFFRLAHTPDPVDWGVRGATQGRLAEIEVARLPR